MEAIRKGETQGKNTFNWEGQYMVIKEVCLGTFRVTPVKRNTVLRIWHPKSVREARFIIMHRLCAQLVPNFIAYC